MSGYIDSNNTEFYTCNSCKEINAVSKESRVDTQKNEQFAMYCPRIVWNMLGSYACKHNVTRGKALLLLLTRAESEEKEDRTVNVGGLAE